MIERKEAHMADAIIHISSIMDIASGGAACFRPEFYATWSVSATPIFTQQPPCGIPAWSVIGQGSNYTRKATLTKSVK